MEQTCSIGTWIEFLTGKDWTNEPTRSFLGWPPDSFAVAARLLRESGAYVSVLDKWPPQDDSWGKQASYSKWVTKKARKWVQHLFAEGASAGATFRIRTTRTIRNLWREIYKNRHIPLSDCPEIWKSLIKICAIADEAAEPFLSFGIFPFGNNKHSDTLPLGLRVWMWRSLYDIEKEHSDSKARTLCTDAVDRSHLVVLPKMRTPQNGITIRSMSHNLTLLPNTEVKPLWQFANVVHDEHFHEGVNLLLFPWPTEVFPVNFQPLKTQRGQYDPTHRFFEFVADPEATFDAKVLKRAYELAQRNFGRIDGVVFPEMALTEEAFAIIERRLRNEDVSFAVGGLYDRPKVSSGKIKAFGKNSARIQIYTGDEPYTENQFKHHRWMLEKSQIRTYGLGAQLDPQFDWWEGIEIASRSLTFLQLAQSFTMSVLICEDLARPDPVGDIIRAVGPNLLIALLQDGPQLASRWPARYATVFADDPGCSVLSLTGLGMTQLSRPANVSQGSRVVALWKQAGEAPREIELPSGAEALVLCLSHEKIDQWTADGRVAKATKGHVSLSGIHPVHLG